MVSRIKWCPVIDELLYMSLNNSRFCSTHNSSSAFLSMATYTVVYQRYMRILVKAQPSTKAPGHDHLLGLAYDRKTWACPMSTVLATVAFLLLLDTSLLSQAGTMHYSQLLTLQHSTKLLHLQSSDHHMRGSARPHLN